MRTEETKTDGAEAAGRRPGLTHERARELAIAAGFAEAGLVALPYAAEDRDAARFREWVGKGRAGSMRYLERKTDDGRLARERTAVPFPWARSAIVCFASYNFPDAPLSTKTPEPGSGWIARYAWSSRVDEKGVRRPSDYHKILLKRLHALHGELEARFGDFEWRAYVDTGPVVERALAVAAGVGWTGKNTCLINPRLGSWGFLAVLLTGLEVQGSGVRDQGSERQGARERVSKLASQRVGEWEEVQESGVRDQGSERQGTREQGNEGTERQGAREQGGEGAERQGARERGNEGTERQGTREQGSEGAERQGAREQGNEGTERQGAREQGNEGTRERVSESTMGGGSLEIPDRCGSCTRCIEACPTHALDVPYQMDTTRCIAYLTIEHKGPIDEELMPGIGRQVFGCDICQDVCPWNGKAIRVMTNAGSPTLSAKGAERMGHPLIVVDPELEPRPELVNPALDWLGSLDEKLFEAEFNGSPVRRAGFNGLRRNVAIAMGNSGLGQFVPRLEEWAEAADEGLRSAAQWALERLRSGNP
jgi:epoxyqueuosine reductase QueG